MTKKNPLPAGLETILDGILKIRPAKSPEAKAWVRAIRGQIRAMGKKS